MNEQPMGLSVWEQDLYDLLLDHVRSESEVLDRYGSLVDTAPEHVRFLVELIAEDEAGVIMPCTSSGPRRSRPPACSLGSMTRCLT